MKIQQVAVQLYTLRDFCKTAADYAASLKKVRAIGYQAIQISGVGPIPVAELRSIAEGEGIVICATHEGADTILNEPAKVVERLAGLGTKYTAYPFPSGIDFSNPAHVENLIAKLDAAGALLRQAGQVLTYHNHAHEFFRVDGKPLLETIYARTDAKNLQGEIDTYWVQAGGGNPVEWVKRLKNRLPLLHLKDYGVDATGKPHFAEIGWGNLDFKAIIPAAEASGCEWFIVEQDSTPGDPFDSLQKSFDYIKANLVS
ncbi:MAG: sugar phosphate isomerase/epimerase [Chthoniobacteraceae bacterium]|nr:sugar phosphate isomerase/epimerase [Chthoniobacteraceae bacterium]